MGDGNLGFLLHNVASSIDRHSDQVLMERLGVSFAHFKILLVLSQNDGSTQNQIASKLGQTEASISRQVKLMEKAKLINIRRSTSNRRLRHIFLTNKGFLQTDKSINALNEYYEPIFGALDEKERINLQIALAKIASRIR